jgi:hypothetical protein
MVALQIFVAQEVKGVSSVNPGPTSLRKYPTEQTTHLGRGDEYRLC